MASIASSCRSRVGRPARVERRSGTRQRGALRLRGRATLWSALLGAFWHRVGAALIDGLILGVPNSLLSGFLFELAPTEQRPCSKLHRQATDVRGPTTASASTASRSHRRVPLPPVSLAAVALVAAIGRTWTDTAPGSWYADLDKPAWTPPGAVFGIVWTVFYLMMAVAVWLVAREGFERADVRRALVVYAVQLVLNLGWTATFFAAERPGWAIVEIAALFVLVVVTILCFRPISSTAAWLLVPYSAWVAYAASLTIGIAALN